MKRIYFILAIVVLLVPLAYFMIQSKPKSILPVINPVNVQEEMVDPTLLRKGRGHIIGDFNLIDQNGKTITQSLIKNKVFVAEYFFTTCGSICPKMNAQMQRIQKAFHGNSNFKILSYTVDPETDTPEKLKEYALKHQYYDGQWYFITGKKEDLYSLARKSFFVLKPAEAQNLGDAGSDFIHTNNFVLIDKKRRIRGYYDGTQSNDVDQLIIDVQLLLDEE